MIQHYNHPHHVPLQVLNRRDPTRTTTLRRRFSRDMYKRFNDIKGLIRKAVEEEDVFGLKDTPSAFVATPGRKAFDFPQSSRKVEAFMQWLRSQQEERILEIIRIPQVGTAREVPWTDVYIEDAYGKGIQHSRIKIRRAGVDVQPVEELPGGVRTVMRQPVHADRAGVVFARTFSELKGITEAMDQRISSTLATGIIQGRNPRELATTLNREVDLGISRARTLARTEVVRAHNMASIQEYRNAGATGITVEAEWLTAGDNRVCQICLDFAARFTESNPMTLEEAETLIPAHPNSYAEDMEVYTKKGWRFIKDVKVGEECLSLNPETFDLDYKKVINTFAHEEDEMVHFYNNNFDLLVTKDHDVFCKRRERKWTKKRDWEFIKAIDVPRESIFYRSSEWTGEFSLIKTINNSTYSMDWFCKFLGWWISEGSLGREDHGVIQLSQSKEKNLENYNEIEKLLEEKYSGKLWKSRDYIQLRDKDLYGYLKNIGDCSNKCIPEDIKNLAPVYLELILDGLAKGDGHTRTPHKFKPGNFKDETVFTTSSKKLADDIGELILKTGARPSFYLANRKGEKVLHRNGVYSSNHDIWYIRKCHSKTSREIKKEIVPYGKTTYCLELPEWHTLLVRRNGKVTWSGNCRCTTIPVF